jgi:replicative DNA helicase
MIFLNLCKGDVLLSTDIKERLQREVVASEGYLVGLFWNDPDNYHFYPEDKIDHKTFLNDIYGYYFTLGRKAKEKGVNKFDDISISEVVKVTNTQALFDKYGSYATIQELMEETKDREENLDAYYNEIKKYNVLKNLVSYFGERVLKKDGNYDYTKMTKELLHKYWNDKILQIALDGDNKYDEHHLLDNMDEEIEEMDKNPDTGLPFYNAKKLTSICTGWAHGHVYMYGGFGGSGKTSFTVNQVIMSCIEHKEKLLVIANEQGITEFRKMLLITALGAMNKDKKQDEREYVGRQRLNEGGFSEEEKERLKKAKEWLHELCDGDKKLITFVFMENYVMEDVKKLVRYYAARGYKRLIIDTAKPSEGDNSLARWERFVEDAKEIYKLARPNGGGLDLAVWMNVQLADSALKMRFLNEYALGEGKKAKNEASVLLLGRFMWDDEYEGGKHVLQITQWKRNAFTESFEEVVEPLKKEKNVQYFLMFTGKNRRGQDNKTGQRILVMKPHFGINAWSEIGWCMVYDDHNY